MVVHHERPVARLVRDLEDAGFMVVWAKGAWWWFEKAWWTPEDAIPPEASGPFRTIILALDDVESFRKRDKA